METGTQRMIARKDGAIGWMTFNNPARHNAVSVDMWQAVPRILDAFAGDDAIRVVVLSGAGGKAFVSGADISEFGEKRASREAVLEYNRIANHAHRAIIECKKPTIAMVQGYCIGGGLAVALCCDLRIASENSRFGVPAQRLLGKDAAPIHLHFEHAARRLDQLHVGMGIGLADFGRQTGGPRLVVSDDAVFNRDTHVVNDSRA